MKIDTSKIEGYSEMSAEDKLKALEEYEFDDKSDKIAELEEKYKKAKESFDKTASELAALKKEKKGNLSELEQKQAEFDEKYTALEEKYNALEKENSISKFTASFIKQGYSETLARKKAEAVAEGNYDAAIACEEEFNKELKKKITAENIKGTPGPDDKGTPGKEMTLEALRKLDPQKRAVWSAEHPEEYKKLYEKKGE